MPEREHSVEAAAEAAPAVEPIRRNPYIIPQFGDRKTSHGRGGYHRSALPDNAETDPNSEDHFRIGVELEMCFKDGQAAWKFFDEPRNWYKLETDGSLSGGQEQAELITVPLKTECACDPEFWKPICDEIASKTGYAWNNESCGFHVHASAIGLLKKLPRGVSPLGHFADPDMPESVRSEIRTRIKEAKRAAATLYTFCADSTKMSNRVFGRKAGHYRTSMVSFDNVKKAKECLDFFGLQQLNTKPAFKKVKDAMPSGDHYAACNITNNMTVEFRQGKGTTNANRIAAVCMYVTLFIRFCQRYAEKDRISITANSFNNFVIKNTPEGHPLRGFIEE